MLAIPPLLHFHLFGFPLIPVFVETITITVLMLQWITVMFSKTTPITIARTMSTLLWTDLLFLDLDLTGLLLFSAYLLLL
jgi:hypothetical protein